ncbi:MAG: tetratricopeptide repeat protein, partial [Isosphaeraceae bacterium]
KDAVGFYRELVREHAENRWIEGELAIASRRLARLLMETASSEDALEAGLEALRLSQTLHRRLPRNPDLRHGIALCHVMLAHVYLKRGRLDEAFASTEAAIPLFRGLVEEFPDRVAYRVDLTGVLGNHGLALHGARRLDQAREIWTTLADELETLTRLEPEFRAYRVQLATARNNLAFVTQGPTKIAHLRQALALRMELSRGSTGFALRDLAQTRKNLATALAAEGNHDESDRLFEVAIQDAERTVTANPEVPEFHFVMGSVLSAFATSLANRGRLVEARRFYESSFARLETVLRDDPKHTLGRRELRSVCRDLGKISVNLGDRAGAFALSARGRPYLGEDPEWWADQARQFALILPNQGGPDDEPPTRAQMIEAAAEAITLARRFDRHSAERLRADPSLAGIVQEPAIQKALAP